MALIDVSRTITIFQRLCQFAEEFTEEHRPAMVEALTVLFRSDLEGEAGQVAEQGKEPVDVERMIDSFLLRLRRTLGRLTLSETELLGAIKENISFRDFRDRLTTELRDLFGRARSETRTHFDRKISDAAGFPARILEDAAPLLRQTKLVSWTLRQPDFSLGDPAIPGSTTTAESILQFFEPKADELEAASAKAVRRRARVRGKQVMKNQEVLEFRTTYALFITLIRSSFRLAGQNDLAKWVNLNQPRRSRSATPTGATSPADTPTADTPTTDTPTTDTPTDSTPTDADSSPDTDPSPDTDQL